LGSGKKYKPSSEFARALLDFQFMEHNTFQRVFPERVSIPVVDTRVGIASINSMSGSDTGIKGLIGEKSIIDAIEMYSDHFFRHEEVHIVNEAYLNSRFDITKKK
jgi:hypothetical protein